MTMFRDLTPEETAQFQEHARNNLPGTADWSAFHPVCREVWWKLACEHDGFDPTACFAVFSDDNPYIAEETPDHTPDPMESPSEGVLMDYRHEIHDYLVEKGEREA